MLVCITIYEISTGHEFMRYWDINPLATYKERKKTIEAIESRGEIQIYINPEDQELFEKGYTVEQMKKYLHYN